MTISPRTIDQFIYHLDNIRPKLKETVKNMTTEDDVDIVIDAVILHLEFEAWMKEDKPPLRA